MTVEVIVRQVWICLLVEYSFYELRRRSDTETTALTSCELSLLAVVVTQYWREYNQHRKYCSVRKVKCITQLEGTR